MEKKTLRERIDAYTREEYGIEPEILPFSHENYEIYRHPETGKWFAVFIVKERSAFGLAGNGQAEILCVKPANRSLADFLMQQPGYLRGYPASGWNWMSMILDGTVPYEDICRWLDESWQAVNSKSKKSESDVPGTTDSCAGSGE